MSNLLNNINPSNVISWVRDSYSKEPVQKALFLTGLAYVSWNLLSAVRQVGAYALISEHNLISRYGVDSWAVITGATDGIGKEFAIQLAERGFNLVLIAKNEDKLGVLRSEITLKYPNIRVRNVAADFTKAAEEGFVESIQKEVSDLDISLLINNFGSLVADEYHLIPTSEIRNLILVNCLGQALASRIFLPKLLGRLNEKTKSGIIDISSVGAANPSPYTQVYGASKVFNDYLSQGLAFEYPQLDILSLKPAYVKSNKTQKANHFDSGINVGEFVNSGLKYLGHTRESYGHWKHQIVAGVTGLLPKRVLNNTLRQLGWEHAQEIKEEQKKVVISEKNLS